MDDEYIDPDPFRENLERPKGESPTRPAFKPEEAEEKPIEIPPEALSADALQGIIDNFIMREGTDYGANEVDYETKIRQVKKQIENGHAVIIFDAQSESVTLKLKRDYRKP